MESHHLMFIMCCVIPATCNGIPIIQMNDVLLYDCVTQSQLMVQWLENTNGRILAGSSSLFSGWKVWKTYQGSFLQVYGVQRGSKWFFISVKNGRLFLDKNTPPTGRLSRSDKRVFEMVRIPQTRQLALKHASNGKFVKMFGRRVSLVDHQSDATAMCMN